MRLVSPVVTENGLGNNIMALARAYLVSQSCRMKYIPPVWPPCQHVQPPTRNGYGHYFPSTPSDRLRLASVRQALRLQRALPKRLRRVLYFGRHEYLRAGIEDAGEACQAYLRTRGLDDPRRSAVVLVGPGIAWGGYAAVRSARAWLNELLLSHEPTRRQFAEIEQQVAGRFLVAMHVRMGDFAARPLGESIRSGERNVRLPLEWYSRICREIRACTDCEFLLETDGSPEEVAQILREFRPIHLLGRPHRDLLGMAMLARADLLVCANSTYSRIAAFLGGKPYVWCADMLFPDDSGRYGYLWEDRGKPVPAHDNLDRGAVRRCFALTVDYGELPGGLKRYAASLGRLPIEVEDDLLYREPVYLLR